MKKWIVLLVLVLGVSLYADSARVARGDVVKSAVIDGRTSDRVHLREEPSATSKSLGLYFTGTEVCYIEDLVGEWVWVNVGSEAGYIKAEFLAFDEAAGRVAPKQPIGVANSWVNACHEPDVDSPTVFNLYTGDAVTILGETETKWYYVQYGSQYGYVMANSLQSRIGFLSGTPSVRAAFAAYRAVLQNSIAFYSPEGSQALYLNQLLPSLFDVPGELTQFAIVDLDSDGVPEVILLIAVGGYDYGVEILHYQDSGVYGYMLGNRSFMELKADGTFCFSSGASDNGFGVMKFTNSTYSIEEITYCMQREHTAYFCVNPEILMLYFVNGEAATAEEFQAAMVGWNACTAATWYDLTNANVNALLSNGH